MKEECGICGVSVKEGAEKKLYKMLIQLQHRGQLSAGITTYNPNNSHILRTHKELGLVNDAFRAGSQRKFERIMESLKSGKGIGHVRYATCGIDDKEYAQPFERTHVRKSKWFSLCFNGNITNYQEIKNSLEKEGYHLIHNTDTEVLVHLISFALKRNPKGDYKEIFSEVTGKLDGAYSLAFIDANGTIVALKDPLGIKPLCYAENGDEFAFASESVALVNNGFKKIKDLDAGHLIIHKDGNTRIERYSPNQKKAHCFFEWVYFAHPASKIEGKLVYSTRKKLGIELAKMEKEKIDEDSVVVAVPDSSTPAANGFAEKTGMPLNEGLIRNRYIGRTFIESSDRGSKVKDKFMVLRDVFKGKKVFLVEDSIVRGTTLKNLVDYIKKAGSPKEIHVRVSCPPIMWPCFYGIDMSSKKEFIAKKGKDYDKMIKDIVKELGIDSLTYQSIDGLVKSTGLKKDDLCMACLNGEYPTILGQQLSLFEGEGRAHENNN